MTRGRQELAIGMKPVDNNRSDIWSKQQPHTGTKAPSPRAQPRSNLRYRAGQRYRAEYRYLSVHTSLLKSESVALTVRTFR